MGVFARIMTGLAAETPDNQKISIDATYLKAHRTASSLRLKKRGRGGLIGRTKGGMNPRPAGDWFNHREERSCTPSLTRLDGWSGSS